MPWQLLEEYRVFAMAVMADHEPNGESSNIKELVIACAVLLVFAIICFLIMFVGML